MKHIRLFENVEDGEELIYSQIQSMIDNNQFLKGKVEANKDTVYESGDLNVHQLDANSDEFKSMNVYTYKDSRGNEFNIKVKQGEGEKTTFLSFIGAKLGKLGDKVVLSVITAFPGKNGVSIANRNEFIKDGLYFTTTSKEVIEMSKGQLSESKILNFVDYVNESLPRQQTVDQWNKLRKMTKGIDIGDRISDLNKQGANIQYYQNVVDSGIESYEDYEKHNKKFIPSWNLKHLLSPFAGESKKKK